MYFAYVYAACKEKGCFEESLFTVQLMANSDKVLSTLKAPNGTHSFVNSGRLYLLEKGTQLSLDINSHLTYIDVERIYWGVYKI